MDDDSPNDLEKILDCLAFHYFLIVQLSKYESSKSKANWL